MFLPLCAVYCILSNSSGKWRRKILLDCLFISPYMLLLLLSCFSRVRLCATPQTATHQAPLSLGFSRQEHWSGLPFPSPVHKNEKWKWSCSVVSDSLRPHGPQPTRLDQSKMLKEKESFLCLEAVLDFSWFLAVTSTAK